MIIIIGVNGLLQFILLEILFSNQLALVHWACGMASYGIREEKQSDLKHSQETKGEKKALETHNPLRNSSNNPKNISYSSLPLKLLPPQSRDSLESRTLSIILGGEFDDPHSYLWTPSSFVV